MVLGQADHIFKITTLLWYNSHTIKFTPLKCTIHWFSYIHNVVQPLSDPRTFSSPQEKLCACWQPLFISPTPQSLATTGLLHPYGFAHSGHSHKWIIQYVATLFFSWISESKSGNTSLLIKANLSKTSVLLLDWIPHPRKQDDIWECKFNG